MISKLKVILLKDAVLIRRTIVTSIVMGPSACTTTTEIRFPRDVETNVAVLLNLFALEQFDNNNVEVVFHRNLTVRNTIKNGEYTV